VGPRKSIVVIVIVRIDDWGGGLGGGNAVVAVMGFCNVLASTSGKNVDIAWGGEGGWVVYLVNAARADRG